MFEKFDLFKQSVKMNGCSFWYVLRQNSGLNTRLVFSRFFDIRLKRTISIQKLPYQKPMLKQIEW